MDSLHHVHPDFERYVRATDATRWDVIEAERWIDYPLAARILGHAQLVVHARPRGRPRCLLIFGEPGAGKSMLRRKFLKLQDGHHKKRKESGRVAQRPQPIVAIELGSKPTDAKFVQALAEQLDFPLTANGDALPAVMRAIVLREVRAIVIDEFNNLLNAQAREQRVHLALIRECCNQLGIGIVALGTSSAKEAIHADRQLLDRFALIELPPWLESEELRSFLAAYERLLPLRYPSNLHSAENVRALMKHASSHQLGGIVERLRNAAGLAIVTKTERITPEIIKHATEPPWQLGAKLAEASKS